MRAECDETAASGATAQTYWRGVGLLRAGPTLAALQAFYARYKYLVLSRDAAAYRRIGRLLAAPAQPLPELAVRLLAEIGAALARAPSRGGNTNALLHIRGYLKRALAPAETRELCASIEAYRRGAAPLAVPLARLREHFGRHPHPYIERQLFMHCDRFSSTAQDGGER
jgi:uncharacterized protein YbgA (DUF1722 family)